MYEFHQLPFLKPRSDLDLNLRPERLNDQYTGTHLTECRSSELKKYSNDIFDLRKIYVS